jgi:hypothetical protein
MIWHIEISRWRMVEVQHAMLCGRIKFTPSVHFDHTAFRIVLSAQVTLYSPIHSLQYGIVLGFRSGSVSQTRVAVHASEVGSTCSSLFECPLSQRLACRDQSSFMGCCKLHSLPQVVDDTVFWLPTLTVSSLSSAHASRHPHTHALIHSCTHTLTHRQICNTSCFSTAIVIRERASLLRYTCIDCLVLFLFSAWLIPYPISHTFF